MSHTEPAPLSPSARVFVSHSTRDSAAATPLAAALEAHGIPCWIAPRDVSPGMRYGEAIIDGINASSLFVLLLSAHSNASPQVLAEVERAVSKGLSILTIRLEAVPLTKSLEYFLSSFHWIDAIPAPIEPHIERLIEAVRQNLAAQERPSAQAPPAEAKAREIPNNLPHHLTSFVGREAEIPELAAMLKKTRLLTLTGSGGTGKTRLSLEVAARHRARERAPEDGIWLVELASLSDPGLVAQSVADVFGVREKAGTPLGKTLCEALREKQALLILDNCEHVLSPCTALAADLLRACPGIQILATSREPLGVPGETTYRVPPLSLPDEARAQDAASLAACEAVRLFAERAESARPGFAVTDANASAVAHVCCRLDGIPLALELAAARVRSLTVEDINTRLDNRFRLLTGGSKALLPRQQTLRALIDWSYDLLTDQEQTLLRRLSVFAGGWSLASAESVCAGEEIEEFEVIDLMTALVDKSLVVHADLGGVGRYRLLETVRQYASERLTESGGAALLRERHRHCFAALAETARPHLIGQEQASWLSRLEVEQDNLREALAWCEREAEQDGGGEAADARLRFCTALFHFWEIRGEFREGLRHLESALHLTQDREASLPRVSALSMAGLLTRTLGDLEAAQSRFESSLAGARQIDDQLSIANALNNLGLVAQMRDDLETAQALATECLEMRRRLRDTRGIAITLGNLGIIALQREDLGAARPLLEESVAAFREIGDQYGVLNILSNLGMVAYNQGDFKAARRDLEESLEIARRLRSQNGIVISLCNLSWVARSEGDYGSARTALAESLRLSQQIGNQRTVLYCLEELADVVTAEGDAIRAGRLWGAAAAHREKIGCFRAECDLLQLNEQQDRARALIGPDAFAAALLSGALMTLDQAASEALAQNSPP